MSTLPTHTVAIIGGGYSGAITAVQLLRSAPAGPLRVLLIERQAPAARGLAYRTRDDNLLLNVPAGNMSALADEPDHFVSYCRELDPAFNGGSFISRRIYGDYLEATLAAAEHQRPGVLERRQAEAVGVHPRPAGQAGFQVRLADGGRLDADQVVLALGHFAPLPPAGFPAHLHRHIVSPWDFASLDRLDPEQPIALLGMGHTAIDALFRATSCNDSRKVYLISRRGLLPHSHRFPSRPPAAPATPHPLAGLPPSVRAYTRALRQEAARREAAGGDWRDVVNELRPHTPALWQGLPPAEQARFLARIVPYWDIHRHRLAPSAARRLAQLLASGQAESVAGRIVGQAEHAAGLDLQIRSRVDGRSRSLRVSALVNCSGPTYDLAKVTQPLVGQLLEAGLLQQDPHRLGLLVDDEYRPLGRRGQPTPGLHYVGPMLKARYWEAIAVPELRQHALQLAQILATHR